MGYKGIFCLFVGALMMFLVGCGGIPIPTAEMENAKTAIQSAEESQAPKYAPVELTGAKTDYSSAEGKIVKKKNAEAKVLAISSYDKAVDAKSKSLTALAKIEELKKNAMSAIADAKIAINLAKDSEAEKYAFSKLQEAENLLAQAETSFGVEDYLESINLANKAIDVANEARRMAIAKKEEELKTPVVEEPTIKTQHVVVKGECFWKIAKYKDIYDNPFMWPTLYKANKSILKQKDNPHLIHPNQLFTIPR
ncbi:MAG: DUF4398 domain-containing protein [bacterium]